MYTSMLDKNVIFQGDGLKKMPIIDLVNIERGVKNVSCLILSNTCDMDLSNSRMFPASIMYAPIINLTTYISVLQKQGVNSSKIENHISDLKQQKITQIYEIGVFIRMVVKPFLYQSFEIIIFLLSHTS